MIFVTSVKVCVKAGSTMAAKDAPGQLQRIPLAAEGSRQILATCVGVLHARYRSRGRRRKDPS